MAPRHGRRDDTGPTSAHEDRLTVVIESMAPADLPEVLAIEGLSFSEPWTEQMFLHELSSREVADLLVARADEGQGPRVVGFLCAWIVGGELHINNVAVHPAYRRRGVASRLLEASVHRARAAGARIAHLEVRASNAAAKALYERYGFKVVGRRRNYYDRPREDAVVMRKEPL
jgi:ribosomal-protein-alanine N-acetyltransferase